MYTVYEQKKYLILIEKNVSKDDLQKYGNITDEIHDNYPDMNPVHAGYVIKEGIKKFYALVQKEI